MVADYAKVRAARMNVVLLVYMVADYAKVGAARMNVVLLIWCELEFVVFQCNNTLTHEEQLVKTSYANLCKVPKYAIIPTVKLTFVCILTQMINVEDFIPCLKQICQVNLHHACMYVPDHFNSDFAGFIQYSCVA